ncbi:hypothetical protein FQA47_012455 [Oryzias melastigma]|uniref:Uncharacterized protein n=1 Tax=Oryzias melastigma TaxID=30732 RepID=A0A834F591_ORYME|nr:hypothetical protein FQA47_012455 [Oryzias melastigma]
MTRLRNLESSSRLSSSRVIINSALSDPSVQPLEKIHVDTQLWHFSVAEFLIENHIFPKKYFEPSGRFHLPQWSNVPGINILDHIYREDPNSSYHPYKMIVQPRLVEQSSVHQLLRNLGEQFYIPKEICRIIHVRVALLKSLQLEELNEDKRLWDFQEKLIPNVDKVLRRAGLLTED